MKNKLFKSFATAILSFILVVCCFSFAGCKNNRPATIKETHEILAQGKMQLTQIKELLDSEEYEYPYELAKSKATEVENTDKSILGVEYSNYIDFDLDYQFDSFETRNEYEETVFEYGEYFSIFNMIFNELNQTYKFPVGQNFSYHKLTNDKSKIVILSYNKDEDEVSRYFKLTINFNKDKSVKSFEGKEYSTNGGMSYTYVEMATEDFRLFNRYLTIYTSFVKGWDSDLGEFSEIVFNYEDYDETIQKMIGESDISMENMNETQSKVYSYFENLHLENLEDIVDEFDMKNAIDFTYGSI